MVLRFVHLCVLAVFTLSQCIAADGTVAGMATAAADVHQIIAHRGSSADRPENTLASTPRAIHVGATAVEVDIRATSDGQLVLLHDATLDRTTDGTGSVGDKTLSEVKALDAGSWFAPRYQETRIPTLSEALELCRKNVDVVLDLKEQGERYARAIAAAVRSHGGPRRTVVGVRTVEQAKRFRRLLPEARQLGLIPEPDGIEPFADAGVETIRLWPRWLQQDAELVRRVREAGAELHLNGSTGQPEETRLLLEHRPRSLSSDDPAALVKMLTTLAPAPDDKNAGGAPGEVVVRPQRIDDVLTNPNMGFADFHMGWHCEASDVTPQQCAERRDNNWPENYPDTAVTYFRWHWDELEPKRGEIDFGHVDRLIQASNITGQTLAFRVMAIRSGGVGIPSWLRDKVDGVEVDGTFWPDYRDPVFQREHRRFVHALGERYDDHPTVDHVDIGPVGCWGEWNTACVDRVRSLIEIYDPANDAERDEIAEAYKQVVTDYTDAFQVTPLVMLSIGSDRDPRMVDIIGHALKRGTGWRVDCWGDWGYFSDNWSHHESLYPAFMEEARKVYPQFDEVWKHAPVQLEVCGVMQQWKDRGWTADAPDGKVHKTFEFALDEHAAVLNAKRSAVPDEYVPAMNDLLRRNGYRYSVDRIRHPAALSPGGKLVLHSTWSNLGVTPSYTRRTLAYRLKSEDEIQVFESDADVRDWLPGSWAMKETFRLPADLPPGKYGLEVAILDRAGTNPETAPLPPLELAIEGRGKHGWYSLSHIEVETE